MDMVMKGEDVFNFLNQCVNKDFKNTIASTDNMLSFFGRANYDYLGRYYLTATMRADASTRFTKLHGVCQMNHGWLMPVIGCQT